VPRLQLPTTADSTVWTGLVTINILPDNVLLQIFHFDRQTYLEGPRNLDGPSTEHEVAEEVFDPMWRPFWRWHRLVHVCQKWRSVAFASPIFLDLRLICGPWTPVELTSIWPPLPIIIRDMVNWPMPEDYDFDAAIVHRNRVCEINLHPTSSQLQRLASATQEKFPALKHLMLDFPNYSSHPAPVLPHTFLGGSAPCIQSLELQSIPFPALPKFLLSATDLVRLTLWDIPHSGYISPAAIVTGLAVSANLESLTIAFESPLSRPSMESRHPPPPTRTILPALTRFEFQGVSEYLEDLVARIDDPLLDSIWINFFHQLIFDIPQLAQFMRRTTRFQAFNEAYVVFDNSSVQLGCHPPTRTFDEKSVLRISRRKLDWQLSCLAQVFTSFFPSISVLEHIYVYGPRTLPSHWQDDIENMEWLEILHPFTSVKNLYASENFEQCITPALQELVGERVTGMLPALESLFLEGFQPSGPVPEAIEQFVAARRLLDHPIAVSHWNRT
jgi:hypothetical protein